MAYTSVDLTTNLNISIVIELIRDNLNDADAGAEMIWTINNWASIENLTGGNKINARYTNTVCFADDTVLLAKCLEDLLEMIDREVELNDENFFDF